MIKTSGTCAGADAAGAQPATDGGTVRMRDGEWLAQHNLKMEINEAPAVPWVFGQPHRLRISMDAKGVTGTILAPDGRLILRRRFAFTAAVCAGRPAASVGHCRCFQGDTCVMVAARG